MIRKLCKGSKLVATAGTFDLLHVGHVTHLEKCRKLGDFLAVLVTSDARVRQKKGPNRPIIPQGQRAKMLDSLKVVDFVIIGFEPQPEHTTNRTVGNLKIIELIRPQVFVVENPAWEQDREKMKSWGTQLIIEKEPVRLHATTKIIETITNRYGAKKSEECPTASSFLFSK